MIAYAHALFMHHYLMHDILKKEKFPQLWYPKGAETNRESSLNPFSSWSLIIHEKTTRSTSSSRLPSLSLSELPWPWSIPLLPASSFLLRPLFPMYIMYDLMLMHLSTNPSTYQSNTTALLGRPPLIQNSSFTTLAQRPRESVVETRVQSADGPSSQHGSCVTLRGCGIHAHRYL